jgi:hypothetical protein
MHYPTVPGEEFALFASVQRDCFLDRVVISSMAVKGEYIVRSIFIGDEDALVSHVSAADFEEAFSSIGYLRYRIKAGTIVRLVVAWFPARRPVMISKRQAKLRKFRGAWWVTIKQRPRDVFQAALLVESETSQ